jgi:hypothetical protein
MYAIYIELHNKIIVAYCSHRKLFLKRQLYNLELTGIKPQCRYWLRDQSGWLESFDDSPCPYDNAQVPLKPLWYDPKD